MGGPLQWPRPPGHSIDLIRHLLDKLEKEQEQQVQQLTIENEHLRQKVEDARLGSRHFTGQVSGKGSDCSKSSSTRAPGPDESSSTSPLRGIAENDKAAVVSAKWHQPQSPQVFPPKPQEGGFAPPGSVPESLERWSVGSLQTREESSMEKLPCRQDCKADPTETTATTPEASPYRLGFARSASRLGGGLARSASRLGLARSASHLGLARGESRLGLQDKALKLAVTRPFCSGSDVNLENRRRQVSCESPMRHASGVLSPSAQEQIRKLASVINADDEQRRLADMFEEELETKDMGIRGLLMKRRLSIQPADLEKASPTKAFVLHLISWWLFDALIGFVIVSNAITIGFETSYMRGSGVVPTWCEIMEKVFLAIYFMELLLRFYAIGPRVMLSHWVKFDAFLVVCGVLDVCIKVISGPSAVLDQIMLVRMLRLVRLARAARLMVQFRTLWLLVQGLLLSCLPMVYTFTILSTLVYIFAVFGMEVITVTSEYGPEYEAVAAEHFCGLGDAMLILVQFIFLDSIAPVMHPLVKARPELCIYFFVFLLLGSISLMNLVTAIMVEGSLRQASEDQDARKAWESMRRKQMAPKLKGMFRALDVDASGDLTLEEIRNSPPSLQQQLMHVCNMDDLRETFEMLDYDNSGSVEVDEFVNGIMRVQADKPAELIRLVKQCSDILKKVQEVDARLQATVDVAGSIQTIEPAVKATCSRKTFDKTVSIDSDSGCECADYGND